MHEEGVLMLRGDEGFFFLNFSRDVRIIYATFIIYEYSRV